jgi:tetratricopeptide (TPR) repeat protein
VIGETQRQLDEYESAVKQLEKATDLFESTVGKNDMQYIECLRRLALTHGDAGQLEKCQELLEQVQKLSTAAPEDPFSLTLSNDLALIYQMRGDLKKGTELLEKSVEQHKNAFGIGDPETLVAMNNLAVTYGTQFNYKASIELLEQVAAQQAAKPNGEVAVNTLSTRRNLATGYREIGRVDESLALYQQVLAAQRSVIGNESVDVSVTINRLAGVLLLKKDYVEAKKKYEESLKLQSKLLPENHQEVLLGRAALAMIESELGNHQNAIELLRPVYNIQKEALSEPHPHTLASLRNLSTFYQKLGNFGASIRGYSRAIELMNSPAHDNWNLYHTHARLGRSYLANKQFELAETHLLKGYDGLVARRPTIPYSHRTIIEETLDDLIKLFSEKNDPEQIRRWKATREELVSNSET